MDRIVEITLRTSKENKIMVEIDEPFFEHFAIVGLFLDSHERTYIANIWRRFSDEFHLFAYNSNIFSLTIIISI